ncbi:hypothetical protein GMA11_00045 [Granulicatella sp. zg-ZJ]|uniref:B3/B4 domain-containing protein n=1 Tax=Granulicatella sp. zg-ZJ TaxID=2678504 RepID=UPI0013D25C6D|nr:phenylalanine--tRNA ligase beta subunit-related protein [Granulicatella sp. zg-ZJ]NEW61770.1 hypothetical protein [Granulicatella sp. zg-ZJ]
MNVIVDKEFFNLFPNGSLFVLSLKGIDNHAKEDKYDFFKNKLDSATVSAKQFLTEDTFTQNEVIKEWREAFATFKTKKGARSSIEALLKRVSQDREFTPINPLVDLYNSVSLSYGVPCGGEDIARIQGDLHLGQAKGGEPFFPLGAEEDSPALPEELIYYDNEGAVCRSLNWREAQRTMLTEETKDAVFVMEAINEHQAKRCHEAIHTLNDLLQEYFGKQGDIAVLTNEQPEVAI